MNEGLPSSSVKAVAQDKAGFIWVATSRGIAILDGHEVKTLGQSDLALPHVPILNPETIFIDSKDRVWISSLNGTLGYIDESRQRFHYLGSQAERNAGEPTSFNTFFESSDATIWVGTNTGNLATYNEDSSTFTSYPIAVSSPNHNSAGQVTSITQDNDNNLWLGTSAGLYIFDKNNNTFTHIIETEKVMGENPAIESLVHQAQALWLGTQHGLVQYAPGSGLLNRYMLADNKPLEIRKIVPFGLNSLWISADQGLFHFDIQTKRFHKIDWAQPTQIDLHGVTDLSITQSDLLLVSTGQFGLLKIDVNRHIFSDITHPGGKDTKVNLIWGMATDANGDVWAGTNAGVLKIDPLKAEAQRVPTELQNRIENRVLSVATTRKGQRIWFGTIDNLYAYDLRNHILTEHRSRLADKYLSNVAVLFSDSQDNLWIGAADQNLYLLDNNDSIKQFTLTETAEKPSISDSIVDMTEDESGAIWLITANSKLMRKGPKETEFQPFEYALPPSENPRQRFFATGLISTSQNTLYISTFSGLLAINTANTQAQLFTVEQGLASNRVLSVVEDVAGKLWLSTGIGVSIYNPELQLSRNFFESDGLSSDVLSLGSTLALNNGLVFFGTDQGITLVNIHEVDDNVRPSPVAISGLWINNIKQRTPVMGQSFVSLTLSSDQKNITFQYSILDHRQQDEHEVYYKLSGFNQSWIQGNAARLATYNNLAPGNYQFLIRTENQNTREITRYTAAQIVITPPIWETSWFRLLSMLLILTLIYTIYKYRIRQLKVSEAKLNQLVKARTLNMTLLSEIGQEITKALSYEDIFEKLQKNLRTVLGGQSIKFGLVNWNAGVIDFRMVIKDSNLVPGYLLKLSRKDIPEIWAVNNRKTLLSHNKQDLCAIIGLPSNTIMNSGMESHICIPLIANANVIGVICAENHKPSAYGDYELQFLQTIASYTAIALNNAKINRQQQDMHKQRISWLENISHYLRHEMKNAMLGAQTSLNMIKRKVSDEELNKYFERAGKSHEEMKAIMHAVSDTTSLEASIINAQARTLNLSEIVNNRVEDYALIFAETDIVTEIQPGLHVNGSAELLNQLLDKLVNNAVEHCEPDAAINVKLGRRRNLISLSVKNIGDPLPADTEKLFELFVSSKSASYNGNFGMGLYIVKLITEFHRGTIKVQPIDTGHLTGAEFIINIPAH